MKAFLVAATMVAAATAVLAPAVVSADGTVDVELGGFFVTPSVPEVEEGTVTFNITVAGGNHELVVIASDLAPDALPLLDGNLVDETQVNIIAQTEPFGADASPQTLTADLAAGNYVLICNVFNPAGTTAGHYVRGMNVAFTVTGAAAQQATPVPELIAEPSPEAPKAGNLGLLDTENGSVSPLAVALFAVLAVGAVVGARRLTSRGNS